MDMRQPAERAIIPKLSDEVYSLVLSYGGSITAEHNDGLIRTPYLEKMYGHDVYELFKKIKQIFDPQDIFNPRKKVGATLEYVMEHMRRD
jgi:FAD/FMN-containing dehydrogenase